MQVLNINEKVSGDVFLALGFFDSIHIGHRKVIVDCVSKAEECGCLSGVFTFKNNPYRALKEEYKQILTFDERVDVLEKLGVDIVFYADFDEKFMQKTGEEFIGILKKQPVKGLFFGKDYRFGRGASGDCDLLNREFSDGKTVIKEVDFLFFGEKKVSTSDIRRLILNGDISGANRLLGRNYAISGVVQSGYQIGRTINFPTANILYPQDKVFIKPAVYKSQVQIDGKTYGGITNVGSRPTFHDSEIKVETYIDGFDGELYGKDITVEFVKFLRDIKKFANKQELKEQLERDKESLKR